MHVLVTEFSSVLVQPAFWSAQAPSPSLSSLLVLEGCRVSPSSQEEAQATSIFWDYQYIYFIKWTNAQIGLWNLWSILNIYILGTSLVVQWLRLNSVNSGAPSAIPGQGTRSHMLQLRVQMPKLKDPHAATEIDDVTVKTRHSQINSNFFNF